MAVRYVLVGLLLTFGLSGVLQGAERPIVRRVRVEGARWMSEDRVRGWLVTRAGISLDSLLLRQDLRRILEGYRDAGYWQAAVAPPEVGLSERGASVRFRVEEGRLTRVASVEVTGNRQVALDALLEAVASRQGTPLVRRRLEADMDALLRVYENRGYPYVALRPGVVIEPGEDLAQVRIAVEEGPFVRVDTIRFTGNRVTRAGVLLREMRLAPGAPYDQRRVDRALQALRRLPFLLEVRGATLEQEGDTGRWALVVAVREASATRFEGGLGYAPGPGGLTHALTGTFTLDFDNLLGTGRGGHVSWGRQGPAASDLNLRYRELWVLGHPLSAEVDLMVRQRPGYVENGVGAGLVLALSPDLGVRVGLRRGGVRPDSSGFGRFFQSRTWALEGGLQYDRRDNRWNPRSGFLYRGRFSYGRALRGGGGQVHRQYALDLTHFLPLGKRSVLAAGLHSAGVKEGDRVAPDARLRLGGTTTIRGHREEVFLAAQAAWANLEWRMLMGRRSRAFLFFDLGYLDDPEVDGGHLFPIGYGVGLRAVSRLGMIGLDYGLTKGDSPAQGKVHVRMVNEF